MGATVTETAGEDYTWDTAPFAWDSTQAALRTWENAHVSTWALANSTDLVLADKVIKAMTKTTSENFSLGDAIAKAVQVIKYESATINECYVDTVAFQLRVIETVAILESLGKGVEIFGRETLALKEAQSKVIGLNATEAVTLLEVFTRAVEYHLAQEEAIGVAVVEGRHIELGKFEQLAVAEAHKRDIGLGVQELLQFSEAFGRAVAYKRAIAEGFSATDALGKAYALSKSEAVRIVEALLRNPNAVVSDMMVSNQDITFQDFLRIVNTGRIPGYSDFRTFVQGDYEYSEAMFRVLMDATSSDRGSITDLKVSVDVPDVFDRGVAFIENAAEGLYVRFSRPFHIPPEMSLLLKGGTTLAFPRLITLDQFGFTVKLFDKNDVAVTGSVSWSAHGY